MTISKLLVFQISNGAESEQCLLAIDTISGTVHPPRLSRRCPCGCDTVIALALPLRQPLQRSRLFLEADGFGDITVDAVNMQTDDSAWEKMDVFSKNWFFSHF